MLVSALFRQFGSCLKGKTQYTYIVRKYEIHLHLFTFLPVSKGQSRTNTFYIMQQGTYIVLSFQSYSFVGETSQGIPQQQGTGQIAHLIAFFPGLTLFLKMKMSK